MPDLDQNVADECNRIDLAVGMAAEMVRMIDAVARGPAGRHLRHCRGADGRPLFAWATSGTEEVIVAPSLLELLAAFDCARPSGVCPECRGEKCEACRHAGYLPADRSLLAGDPVAFSPPTVDVSDIWRDGLEE